MISKTKDYQKLLNQQNLKKTYIFLNPFSFRTARKWNIVQRSRELGIVSSVFQFNHTSATQ